MNIKIIRSLTVTLLALNVSTLAHAVEAGMYVEAQAGMSNTNNLPINIPTGLDDPLTVYTKPSNTGFGGRIAVGYNYNRYVALELGFTHYGNSTYSPSITTQCNDPQIHENALDIVGKGIYPVGSLGVFAKGGLAVVRLTKAGSLVEGGNCSSSEGITTSARPIAALGVSYDMTQNWVIDLTFSRIFGNGSVQNADMAAIGLSYHFVDKYCGQFLC